MTSSFSGAALGRVESALPAEGRAGEKIRGGDWMDGVRCVAIAVVLATVAGAFLGQLVGWAVGL